MNFVRKTYHLWHRNNNYLDNDVKAINEFKGSIRGTLHLMI